MRQSVVDLVIRIFFSGINGERLEKCLKCTLNWVFMYPKIPPYSTSLQAILYNFQCIQNTLKCIQNSTMKCTQNCHQNISHWFHHIFKNTSPHFSQQSHLWYQILSAVNHVHLGIKQRCLMHRSWFGPNVPNQLLHLSRECVMLSQPSHIWLWHGLLKRPRWMFFTHYLKHFQRHVSYTFFKPLSPFMPKKKILMIHGGQRKLFPTSFLVYFDAFSILLHFVCVTLVDLYLCLDAFLSYLL